MDIIVVAITFAKGVVHIEETEDFFVIVGLVHAHINVEAYLISIIIHYSIEICACYDRFVMCAVLKGELRERLQC